MENKERSQKMNALLDKAITGLLSKLEQIACEHCGARAASAQDYSNVLKFLKDNGYMIEPEKAGDELDKILTQMNKAQYPSIERTQ